MAEPFRGGYIREEGQDRCRVGVSGVLGFVQWGLSDLEVVHWAWRTCFHIYWFSSIIK